MKSELLRRWRLFFTGLPLLCLGAAFLLEGCRPTAGEIIAAATATDGGGGGGGSGGTVTYTVTFDSQGGSEVASASVSAGSGATEPTAPTRSGYTFGGWYKDAPRTTLWDFGSDTVTGNTTLYAKWTAISYAITYNLDGGTNAGSNPATYTIEDGGITLASPSKDNHRFDGWYTDAAMTTAAESPAIAAGSTGDKAFWAKWTALGSAPVTLEFLETETITITGWNGSATITTQTTLSATGFDNVKWYVDGGTMPVSTSASFALNPASYDTRRHYLTFTGWKDGVPYSQKIPFEGSN